jgi:cytochrome c oxidase subunit 2
MVGWVHAMEPRDYEKWLTAGAPEGSLASIGEKVFHQHACANCHHFDGQGRCPNLRGLFGRPVLLRDGSQVMADESYVRESILDPGAKIVQGYENIMPTFRGQLGEEELTALVEYIRALGER